MAPESRLPFKLRQEHLFLLDIEGKSLNSANPDTSGVTSCSPNFLVIYKARNPGAIIHSRSNKVLVAAHLFSGDEYRVKNHSMIKVSTKATILCV